MDAQRPDGDGGGGNGPRRMLGQVWLLLSAFGICFALLSSAEEIGRGEIGKAVGALLLGVLVYLTVGRPKRE